MKKQVIYGFAALALLATACKKETNASALIDQTKAAEAEQKATTSGELAVIKFDNEEHDFGTINEGDKVEHTYKFTNEGEGQLIIIDVKPTCGCTVPEYTKEPVEPGQSGEIKIIFNSSGKPNEQSKSVKVVTNTAKGEYQLKFKASVTPKNK